MKKRRKQSDARGAAVQSPDLRVVALGGLEAVRRTPHAGTITWPSLDDRLAISPGQRAKLWKAGRALVQNVGIVNKAVEIIVNIIGWSVPIPKSTDAEWNELARRHFNAITGSPMFDMSGKLDLVSGQLWLERQRSIDGDALIVFAERDGMPVVAYYQAPQVSKDGIGNEGVETDDQGRVKWYNVYNYRTGKAARISASSACLYTHNPSPSMDRGVSDLAPVIPHARDLAEIEGYLKAGLKLSSSVALVETKSTGDKRPGAAGALGPAHAAAAGRGAPLVPVPAGSSYVSLEPGRDLKVISDGRPSANAQAFMKQLLAEMAHGIGLDPTVIYDATELGSAGARYDLEKVRRWVEKRLRWKLPYLNRVWQHVISYEIAAGRLREPSDGAWQNVKWVPCRDMTIDLGRMAAAQISLMHENLISRDELALQLCGRPALEVAEENAFILASQHQLEERYHLAHGELNPAPPGATSWPGPLSAPEDAEPEMKEKNVKRSKRG